MDRVAFHQLFRTQGPVVLPVIHVLDNGQAETNTQVAFDGGCPGVFLINHDFDYPRFLPIIRHVRERFPGIWLGVNFLAVTGKHAFPVIGDLQREGNRIDAYWADNAGIDEQSSPERQDEAEEITRVRSDSGWKGLYFGGTAFKKQRNVAPDDYEKAARAACRHMDVVTTSGVATGQAANLSKIEAFRNACGETAIALASGITPENAGRYAPLVDGYMVATGINVEGDFYNIDPRRLEKLMAATQI